MWLSFILVSCAAVSRLTIKQLQGDNFYSANDAIDYELKSGSQFYLHYYQFS